MAQSDEDKVAAAVDKEVEAPQVPAEPETPAAPAEPATDETVTTDSDEEEVTPSTFTKPEGYEWVKGDTLEEFSDNLRVAYENSTAEALRLRQAQQTAPAATPTADPPAPPSDPALIYAQAIQQKDMVDSFNNFAKKFPQAREPQSFDQFEKASQGASLAFQSANGRIPTYPELYDSIAALLRWQPSNSAKDAAIKAAGSDGNVGSAPTGAPAKRVNINPKTIEIMRRIPGNQNKSDAEIVKDLQPA